MKHNSCLHVDFVAEFMPYSTIKPQDPPMLNASSQLCNIDTFIQNAQWDDLKAALEVLLTIPAEHNEETIALASQNLFNFLKKSLHLDENIRLEIAKLFLETGAHPTSICLGEYREFPVLTTYIEIVDEIPSSICGEKFRDVLVRPTFTTCLHESLAQVNYPLAALLLSQKYNPNLSVDCDYAAPLVYAFLQNFPADQLQALMDLFPFVIDNYKWGYNRALSMIFENDGGYDSETRLKLAKSLILKGAKQRPFFVKSCLHYAVTYKEDENSLSLLKLLLENDVFMSFPDSRISAPVVIAVHNGYFVYVKAITEYLIDHPEKNQNDEFECGVALIKLISSPTFNYEEHLELVKLLIQAGAGRNAWHGWANERISAFNTANYFKLVKSYFKQEYRIRIDEDYLHIAIEIKNVRLIKLLLNYNIIITADAILAAAKKGYWDFVLQFLEGRPMLPDEKYNETLKLLLKSSYDKKQKLINALLAAGADPAILSDPQFATELFALCENSEIAIIKNKAGFMPITVAVINDQWSLVETQLKILEPILLESVETQLKILEPKLESKDRNLRLKRQIEHQMSLCLYFMLEKLEEKKRDKNNIADINFIDCLNIFIELANPLEYLPANEIGYPKGASCMVLVIRKNISDIYVKRLLDKFSGLTQNFCELIIREESAELLNLSLLHTIEKNVPIEISPLRQHAISCNSYACLEVCFNPEFFKFNLLQLEIVLDKVGKEFGNVTAAICEFSILNENKNDVIKKSSEEVLLTLLTDQATSLKYKYSVVGKLFKLSNVFSDEQAKKIIETLIKALEKYLKNLNSIDTPSETNNNSPILYH